MIFSFSFYEKTTMEKILNPKTGRYVDKNGKIGRQILKEQNAIQKEIESKTFPIELIDIIYSYEPRKTLKDKKLIKFCKGWFEITENPEEYVIEKNEQKNPDFRVVNYLISHPNKIDHFFSQNENDLAVKYLIENPHQISWTSFSKNTNDLAVKHCIENSNKIYFFLSIKSK
jgi:hypothetical protein